MKRKQQVLDRLEEIDNHLIALMQGFALPSMTKERAEDLVKIAREKLRDVNSMVNLEDHVYGNR